MKGIFLSGKFVGLGLAVIVSFHVVALYRHWYYAVWWLDIPMHILGGFWVALVLYRYLSKRQAGLADPSSLELFALTLAVISAVGVFWEFYEYFEDLLFKTNAEWVVRLGVGYVDTLKDLADDLLGGVLAFVALGGEVLKKQK